MLELPQIGDLAPKFEHFDIRFPEYAAGHWCVFFAHPANFTTAWTMFSAFLAMKERMLTEKQVKIIALTNEQIGLSNEWANKAKRFIGIYLKAPVIEDLDFSIAKLYGLASTRRPQPGCERLALIIDPQGIIRMIINRPLPHIETAILDIERELDRLQGALQDAPVPELHSVNIQESSDASGDEYKTKPAHFSRKKIHPN